MTGFVNKVKFKKDIFHSYNTPHEHPHL